MVYRVYVEKKPELANEARALKNEIETLLQIRSVQQVRILNRYDVENIEKDLFEQAIPTVFSEPQLDIVTFHLERPVSAWAFAVEPLPGQYDQRADSAAQCIQIISQLERPTVRTARVYVIEGDLSEAEKAAISHHVVNPVESRLASLDPLATLQSEFELPETVATLDGFCQLDSQGLSDMIRTHGLAMDLDDIAFCQTYFREEGRDPTITELKMIDTYWSDHCRHTTFLTTIDSVQFADSLLQHAWDDYLAARAELGRTRPVNLMDIGTLAAKYLKSRGLLQKLDESEEINACTVKIDVTVDGEKQPWLLLFKNETHNHPTEIEPFGGAATCIGGAIRDPLSGRSYVYAAMRVTGAANPLRSVNETMPGKLPQRTIVTKAAAGYSSYGNQIGLATGQVDELYHDGYAAKRMEIGAVIAAAPAENVRRERPEAGDVVILLGGRTGRDGIGGATGSSKKHTLSSLETCGAEVQKGNAPEERKLQRLFRNPECSRLIKRCNDFGAGGVSVAVGELADGLIINLDAVPRKYEGLDGTELAISESQERMAVVVEAKDEAAFLAMAAAENLEATRIAVVTDSDRLVMHWNGRAIVDISREFLNSNGAEKHICIAPEAARIPQKPIPTHFSQAMRDLAGDLNVCSRRGLAERFDSTIGAGTVLMPFGGRHQLTPIQAMVHKISLKQGETDDCSLMSWGYNPALASQSPYHGAYLAVVESASKLIATGADAADTYLTFQEYFEKPMRDPKRWGKPLAALLGAFEAQKDLGIAAIGGKDSMSGSFEDLDVPPTLVSFAVTTGSVQHVISPEFKTPGHRVAIACPEYDENGLPRPDSLRRLYADIATLVRTGKVVSAWTPTGGGIAEGIMKMCFGNGLGFTFNPTIEIEELFGWRYGSFILELEDNTEYGRLLGVVTADSTICCNAERLALSELLQIYENRLEPVYPCNIAQPQGRIPMFSQNAHSWSKPATSVARPRVLIPVFPGTNCEYDSARAVRAAGAVPEIVVIRNLSSAAISESAAYFAERMKQSQIIFIPGGFSGGDEPDGSGKFITAFFRNGVVADGVNELLKNRDGLMAGICNGFQALIKLGLVPFGEITAPDPNAPTLTFNTIGRHQSRLVRTRVASNASPWLMNTNVGDVYTVPISHGEGRFLATEAQILDLARKGQIATQYVSLANVPTDDIHFNPNGSVLAVEGITSPDGRVLGKMGHSERIGSGLYRNVEGEYDMGLFRSAVSYFK